MNNSAHFSKTLAHRIAASVSVTFFIMWALASCGGKVVVDPEGAGGAGGQTSSNGTTATGPSSSSGGMSCGSGQAQPFLACIKPGANGCPSKEDAAGSLTMEYDFGGMCDHSDICFCLDAISAGPKPDPNGTDLCCYDTIIEVVCVV